MSVYVDHNQSCLPCQSWYHQTVCHMMADTINELHKMAGLIGLKMSWFQSDDERFPHYDLTPRKRLLAIQKGAIVMYPMEMVKHFKRKHKGGSR